MATLQRETLPYELRQKAKKELHENEKHIDAHVESFRRWVESLPHITFPKDPNLLLPFLRYAKYRHDKAQARLDNFCTLRASEINGSPRWFDSYSVDDPIVETYLKSGVLVELGRTKEGVAMVLVRLANWDVDVLPVNMMRPLIYMDLDRFCADPITQITGYGMVFDMTGASNRQVMHQKGKSEMKLEMKVWQILRVKDKINKAYDKVPGLRDIMPTEYGGYNGKLSYLMTNNAKRFRAFYSKPSPWAGIRVDESKRPDTAKSYMRDYKDISTDIFETKGTYIAVDPGD
ncbi:unnamed protein product [Echinostoma caproni]|uniref:CRAL-TRIO domain-containing protein n=1 Tax=Echinostoma caproni TaxID=27848 RepID=A0A183A5D0_9TREM|nr:unnamed protein product [Echinostoma caproni]